MIRPRPTAASTGGQATSGTQARPDAEVLKAILAATEKVAQPAAKD
jgi:hypothetical protein